MRLQNSRLASVAFGLTGLIIGLFLSVQSQGASPSLRATEAVATTCFYQREQVSGMNKICYYDCLGSLTAITVRSIDLCPLTIRR
jgi:hypothetical protein